MAKKPRNITEVFLPFLKEREAVPGTWGPREGVLGFFNPFRDDYAYSEEHIPGAKTSGKSSWINNPNVYSHIGQTPQSYADIVLTNKMYSDYQQGKGLNPYAPTREKNYTPQVNSRGEKLVGYNANGDPVYRGDDSGDGSGGQSQDDYMQQIINSMKASLSAIKDMISQQVERAKQIKKDSDEYVSGRYDLLKGDVGTKAQQMLDQLGTEREQVRSQYAQGEGQTARSYEDASLKNRMLARAMGLGPSSYYLQSQMDTREKGLDKLAKLAQERASKFSGISQRETGVTDWKTKKETEIDLEKQKMLDANDSWLKDQIAKANFDERILGINSYDQLANALRQYQANKDAIERYNASRLSEVYSDVGQKEGIYRSDISSQQAIDNNLAQILAQISGLTAGKTPISPTIGSVVSQQAPTSAYPIIDKKNKQYENPFEEYIYGLPANV